MHAHTEPVPTTTWLQPSGPRGRRLEQSRHPTHRSVLRRRPNPDSEVCPMSLCLGPRSAPPTLSSVARAAPSRFNHVKCPPSPALARFVEHYWVTRWDRRGVPPRNAASLLDPMRAPARSGRAGRRDGLGARRLPHAHRRHRMRGRGKIPPWRILPVRAAARDPWTDRVMPADDVFDRADGPHMAWARELSDAVAECRGDAGAHAAIITTHLDAFLGERLPARDTTAEHVADLVGLIAAMPTCGGSAISCGRAGAASGRCTVCSPAMSGQARRG